MVGKNWRFDLSRAAASEVVRSVVDKRFRFYQFVEEWGTGDFVGHLDYRGEDGVVRTTEVRLVHREVVVRNKDRLVDLVLEELGKANAELKEFCGLA